jgi:acid phosphatase (class A)
MWKFLVPAAGVVIVGGLFARAGHFPEVTESIAANRSATLGYLTPAELPDAVALLPTPPKPGTEWMKADEQIREIALPLKGTARYALAAADADREQASTASAFQCAFGTEISAKHSPALYLLLAKIRLDVRAASYPAKFHFKRPRPFVVYKTQTCYPADEQNVREDGSYPSARGAVGWAYAEVLKELNPDRSAEIWQRAIEFGRSRVVCDEEWQSDVEAARVLAAATLKHIEDKPAFRTDFDEARKEVAAPSKSGTSPPDCKAEMLALASR